MRYDAIIIGSGQAGIPLAFACTNKGWNVALIERSHLGGTCINTGCTPTKTMVHRAQVAHYARNASRWGVHATDVGVDLKTIIAQKDRIVQGARESHERNIGRNSNITRYRETARFTGPHAIRAGDATLESDRIFINTGARPRIPGIPGIDSAGILTNESIMELTTVPEHLIVLGGGYIGLEFGQMFARFGSRVTIVHTGTQILPREEPEVAAELKRALEEEGIQIVLNARTKHIAREGNTIRLALEGTDGSVPLAGSHLLVATGREPNTGDLDLEKAGIAMNPDRTVAVNARLETSVPGIWALGDVRGGPAFTHISYNDFQIVQANVLEGGNRSTDQRIVPYCVFTDPQLGGVGMTEREARAKGFHLKIGTVPMTRVARARERDETAGIMKLVVNADNDRILGASVLASEGGETVHVLYTLMLANAPYTLLKGAVYIHPTLAEGFFFLMDAVAPAE